MCARSSRTSPVLFLDTVHHFSQTYAYRDELADQWTP
jgi:3'-phosphoadenosine 5'-phosphosulfate sulfotransferase (PAPS reductase)/FAD synthetase